MVTLSIEVIDQCPLDHDVKLNPKAVAVKWMLLRMMKLRMTMVILMPRMMMSSRITMMPILRMIRAEVYCPFTTGLFHLGGLLFTSPRLNTKIGILDWMLYKSSKKGGDHKQQGDHRQQGDH